MRVARETSAAADVEQGGEKGGGEVLQLQALPFRLQLQEADAALLEYVQRHGGLIVEAL